MANWPSRYTDLRNFSCRQIQVTLANEECKVGSTTTETTTVQKTVTETETLPPKTRTVTETVELPAKYVFVYCVDIIFHPQGGSDRTKTIVETETPAPKTKTVIETETLPAKIKTVTETEQLPPKTKTTTEIEIETRTTTSTATETLTTTLLQAVPTDIAHNAAALCAAWYEDGSRPIPAFDVYGVPQCCLQIPDPAHKFFGDCLAKSHDLSEGPDAVNRLLKTLFKLRSRQMWLFDGNSALKAFTPSRSS
ncbi:unnamed protein product [Diplocarpon coronariae]